MTMIAYAFLQSRRLKEAGGGKKNPRPSASTKPSRYPAGHPHRPRAATANSVSASRENTPI
jgi:SRSO17 transposase